MRSEGFSFYIGVWGWGRVRLMPLWCSQLSAHDRRGSKVAVSMGEAAKSSLSQGITKTCRVVLRGRRGTL